MKKISMILLGVAFSVAAFSQDFRGSAGLEIALPMGDFSDIASLGYGLSVGGELPVGDNLGVTATVGYILVSTNSDLSELVKSQSMIPAQLGAKYYFSDQQEGAYGHAQVGIHSYSTTTEDIDLGPLGSIEGETASETNLSWAIGAGYFVNENIDLGLRYNTITAGDEDGAIDLSYVGVRAAYNF